MCWFNRFFRLKLIVGSERPAAFNLVANGELGVQLARSADAIHQQEGVLNRGETSRQPSRA